MKRILRCGIVIGLLCAMAGPASALSIPDHVDFHAEQTQPQTLYPGDIGWVNEWVVLTNIYAFDDPVWIDDSWLTIDNQYDETRDKHLWLLIDFVGDELPLPFIPDIITGAAVSDPIITIDPTQHVVMWEWVLTPQPDWEDIGFVDIDLTQTFPVATFDFDGDDILEIERIEIATYCVPEPCTLLVCGIGLVGLLGVRRRR
jgi:hypothetical protein